MNPLKALHETCNQSFWIDHLSRSWLADGSLADWVHRGCRGITSNPTIFEKCLSSESIYDHDLSQLIQAGISIEDAYWQLVCDDVATAAKELTGVYSESGGADGFVSVEVSPVLARREHETVEAASQLRAHFDAANIYIKVPATKEGVAAMGPLIHKGINLNITLIFSLERYREVAEAYISALEEVAFSTPPGETTTSLSHISGVASFFVSRVDTEVDSRLPEGHVARGKTAIAQAKLAYEVFQELFSGPRWEALAELGARPQRPLWASTSTKNPDYPDTLYVDNLIAPESVNTLPEATAIAFEDHGTVAETISQDIEATHELWESLLELGIDMKEVSALLEEQGLKAFEDSFNNALSALRNKAEAV